MSGPKFRQFPSIVTPFKIAIVYAKSIDSKPERAYINLRRED